jgi:hypothetical protein
MWQWRSTLFLGLLALMAEARDARACSPPASPAPTAIPRAGASAVSTATSIVVVSPREPFGVGVLANGQPVAVSGWQALGSGLDGLGGPSSFWQLFLGSPDAMLAASANYVVTLPAAGADGGAATLTTFSTAAGYDKAAGTPASLQSLHLWRVRYPVADIASGNCVFAEYAGFITVDYAPATLPNTPAGSLIQTFRLAPDTGGTGQSFVYTGDTPFTGLAPTGAYPLPLGAWQPDLDPTRRYCLTVSTIGEDNLANLGAGSNQLCANVVQLAATGAPPPPNIGDAGGPGGSGGGGAGPSDAGGAAGGPGISGSGAVGGSGSGGGCSIIGAPVGWLGLTLAAAAALAVVRRTPRRRRVRVRR